MQKKDQRRAGWKRQIPLACQENGALPRIRNFQRSGMHGRFASSFALVCFTTVPFLVGRVHSRCAALSRFGTLSREMRYTVEIGYPARLELESGWLAVVAQDCGFPISLSANGEPP